MGTAILQFKPRQSLNEFSTGRTKISLIRRTAGRKSSRSMAIHGENLAGLAALKAGFGAAGKSLSVDLIYIDPPYNVGGEQGYKNIWKGQSEKERSWAGDHGLFLDFMEPRLKIGRALLGPDGMMMVSICDGEFSRLQILMDEIFGEKNRIGTIVWDKLQGSPSRHFKAVHEYILIYAKDLKKAPPLLEDKAGASQMLQKAKSLKEANIPYQDAQKSFKAWVKQNLESGQINSGEAPYKYLHPVTFRPFRGAPGSAQTVRKSRCRARPKHPITGLECSIPENGWRWNQEAITRMCTHSSYVEGDTFVLAGEFIYGKTEKNVPSKIKFLDESMEQITSSLVRMSHAVGKLQLPPNVKFTTPKPVDLIKFLVRRYSKKDAIVLDYFAGSGSTAQAVDELNREDGGRRSWIMIEEMGSTFHEVLLKRLEFFDPGKSYGTYEVQTATVGDKELLNVFKQYSYDFLSAYHYLDDTASIIAAGLNIVGYDPGAAQLVAMTMPDLRKGAHYFEDELLALKRSIRTSNAKSVLIYTVAQGDKVEEPWAGVDRSILAGTSCKNLQVISIPSELVEEWGEVLTAIAG